MIGIDMELPKSCKECHSKWWDNIIDLYRCNLHGYCLEKEYDTKRHPKCKIVALPEENKDMAWDDLKTTYKNKIDTCYFAGGIERITINGKYLKNFKFYSDGTIVDEHFNIISERNEISTICKVIKALIGDER